MVEKVRFCTGEKFAAAVGLGGFSREEEEIVVRNCVKRVSTFLLALLLLVTLVLPAVPTEASALSYSGSASYKSGKYYKALTQVNLTGNQRTDIVNIAKSQVGYQEGANSSQLSGTVRGNGNCTEYGRWYGLQDMWCAMFVS